MNREDSTVNSQGIFMHGVLKINWLDYKRVKSNFAENGKYIWTKKKKGEECRDPG